MGINRRVKGSRLKDITYFEPKYCSNLYTYTFDAEI